MTAASWSLTKAPDTGIQDEINQIDNIVLKALTTFSFLLFCFSLCGCPCDDKPCCLDKDPGFEARTWIRFWCLFLHRELCLFGLSLSTLKRNILKPGKLHFSPRSLSIPARSGSVPLYAIRSIACNTKNRKREIHSIKKWHKIKSALEGRCQSWALFSLSGSCEFVNLKDY